MPGGMVLKILSSVTPPIPVPSLTERFTHFFLTAN